MTQVTPRPMQTPDLAGLLVKPKRSSGPVPAPSTPAEPGHTPSTPADVPSDEAAESAETSEAVGDDPEPMPTRRTSPVAGDRRRGKMPTRPASADVAERQYLQSMAVSLPRSLHLRLADRARQDGITRTSVILTAVNDAHDTLDSALNAAPVDRGSELFDIPQRRTRKEPSVETTIRVTDRQQTAIEGLANTHGVNRSRVISAALEIYLD